MPMTAAVVSAATYFFGSLRSMSSGLSLVRFWRPSYLRRS
jgi:hypothetical protein